MNKYMAHCSQQNKEQQSRMWSCHVNSGGGDQSKFSMELCKTQEPILREFGGWQLPPFGNADETEHTLELI